MRMFSPSPPTPVIVSDRICSTRSGVADASICPVAPRDLASSALDELDETAYTRRPSFDAYWNERSVTDNVTIVCESYLNSEVTKSSYPLHDA